MPPSALVSVLPRWLPPDVWPIEASDVAGGFDARRSAKRRWYRYVVWRGSVPSSTWHGRALAQHQPLDLAAMRVASRSLLGQHDFAAFATQPAHERSTARTVYAADWLELGPLAVFEICANGFLKQMVRGLVGSLLTVGRKDRTPEQFTAALATADRRAAGPNAPAHGLTLSRIEYETG
jgi:tRNA pseudouridine38-40 synthase